MKNLKAKIKDMFGSAQSRYGTYSTLLVVVVIAIVVVVNMVAGQLPEHWKNIDLSSNNLYEITAQSKDLLRNLDKEVELHILADKESTDERIRIFLEKYTGLSSKVSVKWTDPVLHPTVLTQNDANSNTIIVSCEETGKETQVLFEDMITYDEMAYYYYQQQIESAFDAEGQLTSAINYVVNEVAQTIYSTTGHGETPISDTISDLMKKSNYEVKEINTLIEKEIPEDCDLLFLYAPSTDLTEDEKNNISTYMQDGGNVVLVLGDGTRETPNLDALMVEYGLQVVDGYIADAQRSYQQNPYYIFPVLSVSDNMATGIESEMVLLIQARGMQEVDPARDTITVNSFMTTSDAGVAVTEKSQKEGKYILGAVAEEEDSRFTVVSSFSMIDEYITSSFSTLENTTLFMNAVASNFDEVSNFAIEPKSLEITYNTMKHTGISSLIAIFGVPIIILVYGFMKWLRRRKA